MAGYGWNDLDQQHDPKFAGVGLPSPAPVTPDDDSEPEPPDPMPNSEVKPLSADGSVELLHARVGHRPALIERKPRSFTGRGFFVSGRLSASWAAEGMARYGRLYPQLLTPGASALRVLSVTRACPYGLMAAIVSVVAGNA